MKTYRIHINKSWRFRFESEPLSWLQRAGIRLAGWKLEEIPVSVSVTNNGQGYNTAPTVTIS